MTGEFDGQVQRASSIGEDSSKVTVRATVGAAMEKAMCSDKGGREGDGLRREEQCQRRQGLVLEKMSAKFALLKQPSWTVSSISRAISANQQCNLMPFAGLGRTEGLDELWVVCGLRRRWVVIVEEWEVGGGTDVMVAMLSEFVVCRDSCVHYTNNEVFLVNESDVLTNRVAGK